MQRYFTVFIIAYLATIELSVCKAQQFDTVSIFNIPIMLDTYVVKSGFNATEFIQKIKTDTTFYKAFKSMHLKKYSASNDIEVFDENNNISASYNSQTMQVVDKKCRITKVLNQSTTGNFYKHNGDYNYYTAELYDYLFFSKKPVCNETDIIGDGMNNYGSGKIEKNKYQLKQLIFNPGSKINGIPFMGNKANIFDDDEKNKYNFKIWIDTFNGTECYVFKITPKKDFEHKVVYNELTTWFRKTDYSILARNYSLSFNTMFYDFDVTMKVKTSLIDNKLYPTTIFYNGNWHVFSKKREHVIFETEITY